MAVCLMCNKQFKELRPNSKPQKYCNHSCYWQSQIGKTKEKQTKKCMVCDEHFIVYNSIKDIRFTCSRRCASERHVIFMVANKNEGQFREGNTPWFKGKSQEEQPGWRGGLTLLNSGLRKTTEYKQWRLEVFSRDRWTCVSCGYRSKGKIKGRSDIEADHIKPFSLYKDLRLDLSNGRTLCIGCHKETPTYGGKLRWQFAV